MVGIEAWPVAWRAFNMVDQATELSAWKPLSRVQSQQPAAACETTTPKASVSKTTLPSGDQVFKHVCPCRTFYRSPSIGYAMVMESYESSSCGRIKHVNVYSSRDSHPSWPMWGLSHGYNWYSRIKFPSLLKVALGWEQCLPSAW